MRRLDPASRKCQHVKLFLSSYRFGDHEEAFADLVGEGARIAVIAAAVDSWPVAARRSAVSSDITPLKRAGFDAEEVDVRDYDGRPAALEERLREFDCVWFRGGNTFVLRAQLARTGADQVVEKLVRSGELIYAGYSAGACLATPTLIGLDASDDPADVWPTCGTDVVWTGLSLVDFAIVPHGGDSVLADSAETERAVSALAAAGAPCVVLTDRQAVVVDDGLPSII